MRTLHFQNRQKNIFLLCWIVYACAYFARMNISVAMPEIQTTFGWSKTQIGLIGSAFFWIYGIGQLINGQLGDKVSSRTFVFISMICIGITNILFGFVTSLITMVILWSLCGYFQSMIWGPILKTLSHWFESEKSVKVSSAISTSMIAGYILAWGLAGVIIQKFDWKWGFWLPGITTLIIACIWYVNIRNKPTDDGFEDPNRHKFKNTQHKSDITLWGLIAKENLWFIIIACIAKGIVKDSIVLWGPTFLMETQGLNLKSTVGMILFIPFMNFLGIIFTGWLGKKLNNRDQETIIFLFTFSILSNIALIKLGLISPVIGMLFLGLSSGMMFGSNTVLIGSIPIKYRKYNKTSSVAGFLDFISYVAAGLATSLTGIIVDRFGWNGVLVLWITITAVGIIALAIDRMLIMNKTHSTEVINASISSK